MSHPNIQRLSDYAPRTLGTAIALTGALLMSFDPIFIRFSGVGGFDTAFLIGLFTAISMPLFIQLTDKRGLVGTLHASGWPVLVSGLLMLGSASCLVLSIKTTSVANTFVILSTAPALSAVFSRIFLGEVTRRATWIAIVSVMLGIAIVVSGSVGSGAVSGDLLAFAAVTCLSLNQTLLRKYKEVSRMASVGMGGLFLAVVMAFLATPSSYDLSTWLIMGAMGLFTAPFGRVLSQVATRHITAPEVGMILMMEAVFAPVLAFGFFDEVPPLASFLGGGIILITILTYVAATTRQAA
ncbi:MAG: EamA family transporter [Rhodobacteraceae bacterium]|nr:EamA family transporter [Paracoccaceae bacterium]